MRVVFSVFESLAYGSPPCESDRTVQIRAFKRRAEASGIKMLKSFAETLRDHREGILAYYNFRISTGPLEGANNKIKMMKREAYGYRDEEFFTLKIFAAHELKYALVG